MTFLASMILSMAVLDYAFHCAVNIHDREPISWRANLIFPSILVVATITVITVSLGVIE